MNANMRNIHTNHGTLTDPHSIATKIRAILLSHPIPSKLSHPMHDLTHATQYLNWNQTPATLGTEEERPLEPQPVTHNGVPHAHHTKSKKEKERIKKHPQRSTLLSTHEWQHYKYTCPTLQSQATQRVKGDPFKNRHRPHSRKRLDRKGLDFCLGCGGLPLGGARLFVSSLLISSHLFSSRSHYRICERLLRYEYLCRACLCWRVCGAFIACACICARVSLARRGYVSAYLYRAYLSAWY